MEKSDRYFIGDALAASGLALVFWFFVNEDLSLLVLLISLGHFNVLAKIKMLKDDLLARDSVEVRKKEKEKVEE